MLYKKTGFPEENEILICTVKKILPHGVFVSLDEYENREGLIHISEISPGRVRNLRDFVKEEKKIVCKVLRVNTEKNHIDLSLRRVNQAQKINKNKEYKLEQKAEKLLKIIGEETKLSLEELYQKIGNPLIQSYGSLNRGFEEISENPEVLKNLKLDKKIELGLLKFVKERIKKREVRLTAILNLSSLEPNGIEIIKDLLKKLQQKIQNLEIKYIGAPRYQLILTASDYKTAEKQLLEIEQLGLTLIKGKGAFKLIKK